MKSLLLICFASISLIVTAQDPVTVSHENPILKADELIDNYQFEQALRYLSNPEDSANLKVIARRGHCFFRLGNYGNAIFEYQRILRIDSTNRSALFQLAQLYTRNAQHAMASNCFEKLIASDSTNSFYHKQYGTLASQSGDLLTAMFEFKQAVRYNPRDVEGYILLGNNLLELEQYEEADSIMTEALTRIKSPQLRLLLAKAQLEEGKYDLCVETTLSLMKKDTIPAYARLLGVSYFEMEKYEETLPWMDYLIGNGMTAEWVYYFKGVSYRELDQPDSAIQYLNLAIEKGISENIHSYYSQLASTYEEKKDFKNAIKYYKAAYDESKVDILLYHIARNYDVFYKDKQQAITYYKRYLNSEDTIKVARDYTRYRLEELEVLR